MGHIWGSDYSTAGWRVEIAPWGIVYVAASHTRYGPGTDITTKGSLRRYTLSGRLISKRMVEEGISGIAARGALYLTIGEGLERWRR